MVYRCRLFPSVLLVVLALSGGCLEDAELQSELVGDGGDKRRWSPEDAGVDGTQGGDATVSRIPDASVVDGQIVVVVACSPQLCGDNESCVEDDSDLGFRCDCEEGLVRVGDACEAAVTVCEPNPCGSGTCSPANTDKGYACACSETEEFNGTTCAPCSGMFYRDADGDGFGKEGVKACAASSGIVAKGGDCDDGNKAIYPGAAEKCDGVDNNCNGPADEEALKKTFYRDADSDGYGTSKSIRACSMPSGYSHPGSGNQDCDDGNRNINPGKAELCDGVDNNCNGNADEEKMKQTYYRDADSDGYGTGQSVRACKMPSGYSHPGSGNQDCNDGNRNINPGKAELCDGVDNNCNGNADEERMKQTYYRDADSDGYGTGQSVRACRMPAGYSHPGSGNQDCNDGNRDINPGKAEICDGVDNDCRSGADNGCWDSGGRVYGHKVMYRGFRMVSGSSRLEFQHDGNLVLYGSGGSVIWHASTHNRGATQMIMGANGELSIHNAAGVALWWAGTGGFNGAHLRVTGGGSVIIVDAGGRLRWENGVKIN